MRNHFLSVVIPCRDYGQYLDDAVESALQQEGFANNIEIIVIDDHSSDSNTLRRLRHWDTADPRVRVVHNPGPVGAASARNFGIAEASGEWIAFLDADDIWLPHALRVRWRAVQSFPETQWIGADFVRQYENGTYDSEGVFKSRSQKHEKLRHAYESDTVLKLTKPVAEFLHRSLGWTSTIMAKKALLEGVGGFDATLGNYEDHHLWIRLAYAADFYFVPKVVAYYRDHPMSVSRNQSSPAGWYIVAMHLLQREPHFRPYRRFIRKKLGSLFVQNASYYRSRGEWQLAAMSAGRSILYQPLQLSAWRSLVAAMICRR